MGIATVLRNGAHGEISHTLFCITGGKKVYLSKPASDKMMDFGTEQLTEYYDEGFSMQNHLLDILTGDVEPAVIKYKIAVYLNYINKEEDVIEMSL